jgi:tight adherence protein C
MGPFELLTVVGVFVLVALLSGAVTASLLDGRSVTRRRLERVASPGQGNVTTSPVFLVDAPDPGATAAARFIPKSPSEMNRLQRRLTRAGIRHPMAPVILSASELVLPIALVSASLLYVEPPRAWLLAAFLGIVGYLLPGFWLAWRTDKRKTKIRNGLADSLDLLIVCVEAGMGLDQAVQKAAEELEVSHPELAEELATITTEMRAGKPRRDAFKNFAERTKVDEVQSFVAMLAQTDRFGTSIAQGLRVYADSSRTKRRQRAEEAAGKLGVKLVFPLVFCLFPAMYVVTLGPAVIQFVRVFFEQMVPR